MRKASWLINTMAGIFVAIPLIITKWNIHSQTKPAGRDLVEYEVESIIEHNAEPQTEIEKVTEIIPIVEETTALYRGYDFIPFDEVFQKEIMSLCAMHEIAYELILAVIKTETEFEWRIGDSGQAVGYMQIWPKYWQQLADEYGLDLYEPIDNVHMGIIIISTLLESNSGSLDKTLKEYNSGNPDYESNEYLNKVYENYEWIMGEIDG